MGRCLVAGLMLGLAVSTAAQTEVSEFRPGVTVEGVNYFLPKTRLRMVIVADKAVTIPGEFAQYANRYLRLTDVPAVETTEWKIRSVAIQALGTPDSTKAFSIKVKSKTSAPLVSLTHDGLLLGVNTSVQPDDDMELPERVPAPKPLNGRDFMTQGILSAGSTAKMAQLTAEEIYDIRESRNALIRGEADNTPKDGAQLKLMLDNIDRQLAALESLFKGQTLTSQEVLTLDYEPVVGDLRGHHLLVGRFSKRLGLVDADDLSGEPLLLDMEAVGNLPASIPDEDTERKKAKMEQGLRVNQPALAKVTLSLAKRQLVTAELPVCQFGTVEVLSDILFNKKMETRVVMHQHTGSVKQILGEADE